MNFIIGYSNRLLILIFVGMFSMVCPWVKWEGSEKWGCFLPMSCLLLGREWLVLLYPRAASGGTMLGRGEKQGSVWKVGRESRRNKGRSSGIGEEEYGDGMNM